MTYVVAEHSPACRPFANKAEALSTRSQELPNLDEAVRARRCQSKSLPVAPKGCNSECPGVPTTAALGHKGASSPRCRRRLPGTTGERRPRSSAGYCFRAKAGVPAGSRDHGSGRRARVCVGRPAGTRFRLWLSAAVETITGEQLGKPHRRFAVSEVRIARRRGTHRALIAGRCNRRQRTENSLR